MHSKQGKPEWREERRERYGHYNVFGIWSTLTERIIDKRVYIDPLGS